MDNLLPVIYLRDKIFCSGDEIFFICFLHNKKDIDGCRIHAFDFTDIAAMLVENRITDKKVPIGFFIVRVFRYLFAEQENVQVNKPGCLGFAVYVFEFHPGIRIGYESDLFDKKRDENTVNIQEIKSGIDIGVRRLIENERNLEAVFLTSAME